MEKREDQWYDPVWVFIVLVITAFVAVIFKIYAIWPLIYLCYYLITRYLKRRRFNKAIEEYEASFYQNREID